MSSSWVNVDSLRIFVLSWHHCVQFLLVISCLYKLSTSGFWTVYPTPSQAALDWMGSYSPRSPHRCTVGFRCGLCLGHSVGQRGQCGPDCMLWFAVMHERWIVPFCLVTGYSVVPLQKSHWFWTSSLSQILSPLCCNAFVLLFWCVYHQSCHGFPWFEFLVLTCSLHCWTYHTEVWASVNPVHHR